MKKIILFLTFTLLSTPAYSQGAVKSFGDAVTGAVKNNTSKNVKAGIYGKSSLDALKEDTPKTVKVPDSIEVDEVNSGLSLDTNSVKKNQNREVYIANALFFIKKEFYDKALSEFNKAKSVSSSQFIDRWIEVTNSKIESIKMNKIIEELKFDIDKLKAINTQK